LARGSASTASVERASELLLPCSDRRQRGRSSPADCGDHASGIRLCFSALGKKTFWRVLKKKYSVKKTFSKYFFIECFLLHLAKTFLAKYKKTLEKENFKSNSEALNEFKSKSFQLQSYITS